MAAIARSARYANSTKALSNADATDGVFDAGLQEAAVQTADDRSIFLSTMPASNRDRRAALAVVGVSSVLFVCAVPFAKVPLTPVPAFVASYQSVLATQRSDHRDPAIFTVQPVAVAGAAVARERISVHRGRSDRPRPDFSGPVRAGRAFQRRPADDGLALHGLAWRISDSGARLRAAQTARMAGRQIRGSGRRRRSSQASLRSWSRCRVTAWITTART